MNECLTGQAIEIPTPHREPDCITSTLIGIAEKLGGVVPPDSLNPICDALEQIRIFIGTGGGGEPSILVGYVNQSSTLPTTRRDGSALVNGDYVLPEDNASFPFTIDGVTFPNRFSKAIYVNGTWTISSQLLQKTSETPTDNKINESISGTADVQSKVNKEIVDLLGKTELAVEDISTVVGALNYLNETKLIKYQLHIDNDKLVDKDNNVITSIQAQTLYNDKSIFLFLQKNNIMLLPQTPYNENEFKFTGVYYANDYSYVVEVLVDESGNTTLNQIENEKTNDKVFDILDWSNTRSELQHPEEKYPNADSVVDLANDLHQTIDVGEQQFIYQTYVLPAIQKSDLVKIYDNHKANKHQTIKWGLYGSEMYLTVLSADYIGSQYSIDVLIHNKYHCSYSWTNTTAGLVNPEVLSDEFDSFIFKGYISSNEPTGTIKFGEMWYVSDDATMPTTFPIQVKTYDGEGWTETLTDYTPESLDLWANLNSGHGYYWFGNDWNGIDVDVSFDNITIDKNAAGQLEIKDSGVSFDKLNNDLISINKFDKETASTEKLTTEKATIGAINQYVDVVDELPEATADSTPIVYCDNSLYILFKDSEITGVKFTAVEPNSSIKLTLASGVTMTTSTDGETFSDYTTGTVLNLDNAGDFITFKAKTTNTNLNGSKFTMTGKIAASGNVQYLLDATGEQTEAPDNAFASLFNGCKVLTTPPELPATTVGANAYKSMFSGCSILEVAPELPATTLNTSCYQSMFNNCKALTETPELPATTLAGSCYRDMFYGCTGLTSVSTLPAMEVPASGYYEMFYTCTSLETAPELPATVVNQDSYRSMFFGCTSLTTAPSILPATTLATQCYSLMFKNCSALTTTPELPALTAAYSCYASMFYGCSSLRTAPELPATSVGTQAYSQMFQNCTSLENVSDLPATTLVADSYYQMFYNCTALVNAPNIAATTVGNRSCADMFSGCTSLRVAPSELKATTLGTSSYSGMFNNCTSLRVAPNIEATTLGKNSCQQMFTGCTSLETAPMQLKAEVITEGAYDNMFAGCTALVNAPMSIDATTIDKNGCKGMFYGCVSLRNAPTMPRLTSVGLSGCSGMFNVCESLKIAPDLPATTLDGNCYMNMFKDCTALETVPELPASTVPTFAYESMFQNCTSLTIAPDLSATNLDVSCYQNMFKGCTALQIAPDLPATTITDACYAGMFSGCTSLVNAQTILPATELKNGCYSEMFQNCTSLVVAPELPATTLVEFCYDYMFNGCRLLNSIKALMSEFSLGTEDWVDGVADSGTFTCSSSLAEERGVYAIPEGWTINRI